jgi:hypothetical protein
MTLLEMQQVCDKILTEEGHSVICVKLGRQNAQCSFATKSRIRDSFITIAPWIFNCPEEIQLAEIIHESCHITCDFGEHHGPNFRQKEIFWLSKYGLKPVGYKRAYARFIETSAGQLIPIRGSIDNKKQLEYHKLLQTAKQLKKRKQHLEIEL